MLNLTYMEMQDVKDWAKKREYERMKEIQQIRRKISYETAKEILHIIQNCDNEWEEDGRRNSILSKIQAEENRIQSDMNIGQGEGYTILKRK